jgi:hypothetical protein
MNHRIKQFLVAAAVLGCAHTASAAERNPALDLLVKKGLITAEERAQALEQSAMAKMAAGPRDIPWYEKVSIDGYTQVRHTEQMSTDAYTTRADNDRSLDPNQSLIVRRGRFKLAGDFGRVYLYSQWDLAASVDSGSKANFGLQTRDLYADIALDEAKEHRVRVGVSKVPYGWVNLQSSQNRLTMERPEALNSAVEGERDQGVYYMYASTESRALFKSLVKDGLKGSGDYGVFTAQIYEAGVGAYAGRFKIGTEAISGSTPAMSTRDSTDGFVDRRASAHFIMYPQPWGIEAEWTTGQGPQMNDAKTRIEKGYLNGGYVLVNYRHKYGEQSELIPFVRWNYFDGARKFGNNAPKLCINEVDLGFEWQWRKEVELQLQYTFSDERTNSSSTSPTIVNGSQRVALQLQFNY